MEFCVDSIYRLPFSFQNQEKWQEDNVDPRRGRGDRGPSADCLQ